MPAYSIKRPLLFAVVFIFTFAVCVTVTALYVQKKCRIEYLQMEHLVSMKTSKIANVITKLLYKTQTLSALVIQNNGNIKDFRQVASTIIDDPAIKNVILAPGGVVSHIYPLEGNERVLGLDYFSAGEGNKEAVLARSTGQLVLGGPFNLIQGGQALVGRLPVYLNDKNIRRFWGLVSVTLNYPQALDGAELEQLKNQGFAYEIWRVNPDSGEKQVISNSNYIYNRKADYVEKPMKILNSEWYFRLSPIRMWYQHPETWIYSLAGMFISFLMAFLIVHNRDLRSMKTELEELTNKDPLTGILNRRGLFTSVETVMENPGPGFVLCYMDINKFKYVNDNYGHNAGDKLLQHFSAAVSRHTDGGHIFARVGGDEFILVFTNTGKKREVDLFLSKVRAYLEKSAVISRADKIAVTFSAGMAVYPADGRTLDDLISCADNAMYKEKEKYRNATVS